jgi:hypothetical protein
MLWCLEYAVIVTNQKGAGSIRLWTGGTFGEEGIMQALSKDHHG